MRYDAQLFKVLKNEEIAPGIFDMWAENDSLPPLASPGQFAHIKVPGKTLRRPISICDKRENALRFVYQIKGEGTDIMSRFKAGESVDIMAPLGHGFDIEKGKKYCMIGGGIGVPPMLFSAKSADEPIVITGFRNKDLVILQEDFKDIGAAPVLCTDDGSAGEKGFVTDILKEKITSADEVCACGPYPMLRAINRVCAAHGKRCQVSLEERMGCGIGACLVCACKVKRNGEENYLHVCKDGPVFWGEEVFF